MPITPLWTAAELDEQIAAWKKALLKLATHEEYEFEVGGERHRVKRTNIAHVEKTLSYLQGQRVQLAAGSGPQSIVGRVYRG